MIEEDFLQNKSFLKLVKKVERRGIYKQINYYSFKDLEGNNKVLPVFGNIKNKIFYYPDSNEK